MTDGDGRDVTVVLVHGAFAGPSVWSPVTRQLHDEGIPVESVTNPMRSLYGDADSVARAIREVAGKVLLVGHGYGGAVISTAATQVTNAVGLAYVVGYALDVGENVWDIAERFPATELTAALRPSGYLTESYDDHGEMLLLDSAAFAAVYAADLPAELAETLAGAQRPITHDCLTQRAHTAAWKSLRSWYLVAADDRCVEPRAQRAMADRAGSHLLETAGSHAVVVSQPTAVVDMLVTAISVLR